MDFQMPPPNYDNRGPGLVTCAVVGLIISSIAVVLRFWSRAVVGNLMFWWDDWAIVITMVLSHTFLAMIIFWTTVGLGQHTWMVPMDQAVINATSNLVSLVLYTTCIWFIKVSALLLYARIFKRSQAFLITLWALGIFVTLWWIAGGITPWMFCNPLRKNIDPFVPGECWHPKAWYLSSAFMNAFLDLVILVLPLPAIWRLQMTTRRKINIVLVFVLGYSSAFLSFARFIIIVRDPKMLAAGADADPSWNLVDLLYLSMLEAPLAIIALCGPSVNQLCSRAIKYGTLSSLFTTSPQQTAVVVSEGSRDKASRRTAGSNSAAHSTQKSAKHTVWPMSDNSSTTAITEHKARVSDDDHHLDDIAMASIRVDRDVELARK